MLFTPSPMTAPIESPVAGRAESTVRSAMRCAPTIPGVYVGMFRPGVVPHLVVAREGDDAFVNFTAGEGGGQSILQRRGGRWCYLGGGGGGFMPEAIVIGAFGMGTGVRRLSVSRRSVRASSTSRSPCVRFGTP